MDLLLRFRVLAGLALLVGGACAAGEAGLTAPAIYTETVHYADKAANGGERYPSGAALLLVSGGQKRPLVPGFAASADAAVSFDGLRILFSGKQKPNDSWQIWEVALRGGTPRRLPTDKSDAITPFYLPGDRIVYSRRTPSGFQIMTMALDGGAPQQLTFALGDHVVTDVLRDGRILFEAAHPAANSPIRDIFAVYSDGSGVETYRCDHGRDRYAGMEVASGDIVFNTSGRYARFTSPKAVQVELPAASGQFAGRAAELSPGELLVSWRPGESGPYGLYRWKPGTAPEKVLVTTTDAVQPVIVRPHAVPKRHPSALGDRDGANLLCLNVYSSKLKIAPGSVATVRVVALDDAGSPVVLGLAPVAADGSFFVNPPSERAIRFELLDRSGRIVAAEQGWFWARRGEQRVCVGCHAGPERAPENAVPATLLHSTDPVRLRLPGGRAHGGSK